MTEIMLPQVQAAGIRLLRRLHGDTIRVYVSAHVRKTKIPECQDTCYPSEEITSTMARTCVQNAPRIAGNAGPAVCTHGMSAQKSP